MLRRADTPTGPDAATLQRKVTVRSTIRADPGFAGITGETLHFRPVQAFSGPKHPFLHRTKIGRNARCMSVAG
jgi:hypothetical protein